MNNYINFYYELYPDNIVKNKDNYTFVINNEKYYFTIYNRDIAEIDTIFKLNREMIARNSLVHEIILNKKNEPLTLVDGVYYILLRVYVNDTKIISIDDILFMLNSNDSIMDNNIIGRTDWVKLWSLKIDYFEYQIGHLIKKYPYIYNTVDYYIGLGENAIEYIKELSEEKMNTNLSVTHRRIGANSTLFDLYNPLNLVIDYKVRDIAEYIKMTLAMHKKKFTDIAGIGIGVPGAVRDDGTVNKCVNLGWDVVNVPKKLSELLIFPKEKIKAGNDANVAALGEYWKGSGKEYSSIMMVTIGTGVGGGLIIDGKPINGFNGAAAEIGHMPLVDGLDFACNCGKTGCLEQVASATGIARLAGTKNAKEVFDRAKAGDKDMEEVIEKVCSYIGKGLACAAAIADPECFVIGGGVSAAGDYFIDKIKKYYKKQAFHPSIDTAIVKASLLNDAGIYGAAKLAL